MRYVLDIENYDTLTVGDLEGVLEVTLRGTSLDVDSITFHLNEKQLDELLYVVDLIKSLRPKKTVSIPGGVFYPPGVRGHTTTNLDHRGNTIEDRQYEATDRGRQ